MKSELNKTKINLKIVIVFLRQGPGCPGTHYVELYCPHIHRDPSASAYPVRCEPPCPALKMKHFDIALLTVKNFKLH